LPQVPRRKSEDDGWRRLIKARRGTPSPQAAGWPCNCCTTQWRGGRPGCGAPGPDGSSDGIVWELRAAHDWLMEAVADGAEDVVALPVVHVLQLDVADVAGVVDGQVDADA